MQEAQTLEIETAADADGAAELLQRIHTWIKHIQADMRPTREAAHRAWRAVIEQEQAHVAPLKAASERVKDALARWQAAEERRQREEDARRRMEAQRIAEAEHAERLAAAAERADAAAAAGDEDGFEAAATEMQQREAEPVVSFDVAPPAAPNPKGVSVRKSWTYRVTDVEKIPRKYLKIDAPRLRQVVRAMGPDAGIPGIEVYEDRTVAVRVPK
jgi:flagellar biosynthesis/type III secretory pathway protein FliH